VDALQNQVPQDILAAIESDLDRHTLTIVQIIIGIVVVNIIVAIVVQIDNKMTFTNEILTGSTGITELHQFPSLEKGVSLITQGVVSMLDYHES
jgi:hypothetical protein